MKKQIRREINDEGIKVYTLPEVDEDEGRCIFYLLPFQIGLIIRKLRIIINLLTLQKIKLGFLTCTLETDQEYKEEVRQMKEAMPFAVSDFIIVLNYCQNSTIKIKYDIFVLCR